MNGLRLSRGDEMPQDSGLDVWLGVGVLLILLLAVGFFARRRSQMSEDEVPSRLMRICCTAAGFSGAITLDLVVEWLWKPNPDDQVLPSAVIAAIVMFVVGMVMFGIADFWLGLRRPSRTRGWLVVAILVFAALAISAIAIAFWTEGSNNSLNGLGLFQVVIVAAIAAIVWWSFLQLPRGDVAQRFD